MAGRVLAVEVVQPTKLNAELRDPCGSKLAHEHWPNVLEVRQIRKQLAEHLTVPRGCQAAQSQGENIGYSRADGILCGRASKATVDQSYLRQLIGQTAWRAFTCTAAHGMVLHADASQEIGMRY